MKDKWLPYQFDLLESILHGVVVTDLQGKVRYWNQSAENILGYSKKDVMNRPATMFRMSGDTPLPEVLSECRSNGMMDERWNAVHKNGKRIWLDVRLNLLQSDLKEQEFCVISMVNVCELINTQKRLHDNVALTDAIFRASVDAMVVLNRNGEILIMNEAALEMFGYSANELIGKNVNTLMPHPHNVHHDEFMFNYLLKGKTKIIGKRRELHAIKKNGTVFPIELAVSEVKNEGEHLFTGIIKDITERRNLEKEILNIGEDERKKIGRELHDGLGQMLTGVRMLSEALARRLSANALPGADEVKEISEMIQEADQYARALSRGMVEVDMEKNGLTIALENLAKRTSHLTGAEVDFRDTGRTEIDHHAMALHLYRIAQESVSNAIKHGKATIVHIRLSSNPEHTSLIIEDNGEGFDMEQQASGLGSDETCRQGAGLHIMKHRANVMGGIFGIDRTEEGITRVRCVVPNNLEYF